MKKTFSTILLLILVLCVSVSCDSGSGSITMKYIGNTNTKVFHKEGCSNLPSKSNRIIFDSRADAISAGYSACKKCKP